VNPFHVPTTRFNDRTRGGEQHPHSGHQRGRQGWTNLHAALIPNRKQVPSPAQLLKTVSPTPVVLHHSQPTPTATVRSRDRCGHQRNQLPLPTRRDSRKCLSNSRESSLRCEPSPLNIRGYFATRRSRICVTAAPRPIQNGQSWSHDTVPYLIVTPTSESADGHIPRSLTSRASDP